MKMFSKAALLATAGSVLVAATPAQARHGNWNNDRIDVGDVISGVLILGGIAAVASAVGNRGYDNDYGYRGNRGYGWDDRGGYNNGYNSNYGSRYAVDQCVRAAQREAGRYGWARVTDVTSIDRDGGGGYEIRGRVVVQDRSYRGGYRGYDRGYDRGYGYGNGGYDRGYHYDRYNDGYDKGRFSCVTRFDRVVDIRLGGLRNYY